MSHPNEAHEHHEHGHHVHHSHPEIVVVTVDNHPHRVKVGLYLVSEFKALVGVAPDRELDEIVGGHIKPLDDSDKIKIDGREKFISHVRCGSSA